MTQQIQGEKRKNNIIVSKFLYLVLIFASIPMKKLAQKELIMSAVKYRVINIVYASVSK